MNEEDRRRVLEEGLVFFGAIGADVSHEMRNVLAIINEYAGLLDDLLAGAERGRPLECEKLKELSAKIAGQVRKGTETMKRFSRFAHTTDEQMASFDLAALTANMVALAQRRFVAAGCRLEVDLPDEAIPVRTNPFSLQHVLVYAIQLVVESLEKGGSVVVKVAGQGPVALISVSANAASCGVLTGRLPQLSAIMAELKGNIETSLDNERTSLIFSLPKE